MPNQRKKDKKLVGFFADPLEYDAIQKLAKKHAVSVAELLRRIANGTIKLGLWLLGLVGYALMALTLGGTAGGLKARAQAGTTAAHRHGTVHTPQPGKKIGPFAAGGVEKGGHVG